MKKLSYFLEKTQRHTDAIVRHIDQMRFLSTLKPLDKRFLGDQSAFPDLQIRIGYFILISTIPICNWFVQGSTKEVFYSIR